MNEWRQLIHERQQSGQSVRAWCLQNKKDVVKQLPVKSSQAYDLYAKADKLTREFLFK